MKKCILSILSSFVLILILLITNGSELLALAWEKIPVNTQIIESINYPYNTKYGTKTQIINTMHIQYQYNNSSYSKIERIDMSKVGYELSYIRVNQKNPNIISFYKVNWFISSTCIFIFLVLFISGIVNGIQYILNKRI